MTFFRPVCFFVILISSFVITSIAQEETPPPKEKQGIQLEFVPPPMQGGTISLGIYDSTGKLVRVLHQEAQTSEFFAALNGFITYWDGKDGSGKLMPAGKYFARGYMVGAMDFEGVAMLGNDFIADDKSPRFRRFLKFGLDGEALIFRGETAAQRTITWVEDLKGNAPVKYPEDKDIPPNNSIEVKDGKVFEHDVDNPAGTVELKLPALTWAVDACWEGGTNQNIVWVIDYKETGCEVKEYTTAGELLRRLAINPGEPKPWMIASMDNPDRIFLLEGNNQMQRVRGLELVSTEKPEDASQPLKSTWKVIYSKTIRFSDTIDQVSDLLKTAGGKPFTPQDKIRLTLLPNPLEQDKLGAVDISIGTDAKGSFLKAGDGLPLCRISETPNLRWAAMSGETGSKVITIFQSDGAVVEQFKAGKLANMMSFDCGDFDFDPTKIK